RVVLVRLVPKPRRGRELMEPVAAGRAFQLVSADRQSGPVASGEAGGEGLDPPGHLDRIEGDEIGQAGIFGKAREQGAVRLLAVAHLAPRRIQSRPFSILTI